MMLATAGNDAIPTDQESATSVLAMRQACRNIMYTMVNSYTYENYDPHHVSTWVMAAYIIDGVALAALAVSEVVILRGFLKKKKEENV